MSSMNRVCGRVALGWALAAMVPVGVAWAQAAPEQLTLAQALEKARGTSPSVQIANAQTEAAKARVRQAGAGINPEASYEVENFGGDGDFTGRQNAESTVGLSQVIELGGKRSARRETATKQADSTMIQSLITRADLDLAVRERFAEASAAEEQLELVRGALERANRLSRLAQTLVDAGREPPLRLLRAQAAAAAAQARLNVANAELAAAQRALTALWGDGLGAVDPNGPWEFQDPGEQASTPPDATLDYRLAKSQHDAAEAALRLEKANSWIDVTVDAGVRQFEATNEQAFVAGITIPIPIQNRNSGAIAAARAEDRAAELQLSVALVDAVRKLTDARAAFEAADATATALETGAVRQAEEALNLAQVGYEAGRFQLIDVLDAEEAFSGIRDASIEARLARARASAALIRANAR